MESNKKISLFCLLIAVVHSEDDFTKKIVNLSAVGRSSMDTIKRSASSYSYNRERYSVVHSAMTELQREFEKYNITVLTSTITVELNKASDVYSVMTRVKHETCSYNDAIYRQLLNLPKLEEASAEDFGTTASWVLNEQAEYLNNVVRTTVAKLEVLALRARDF